MQASKAFEIAMNSPQCAAPRGNILEEIYAAVAFAAAEGRLGTTYRVNSTSVVLSQVVSCLRHEGYTVNPGFSNGEIIINWA